MGIFRCELGVAHPRAGPADGDVPLLAKWDSARHFVTHVSDQVGKSNSRA
jgi:hypothetical protein